MLLDEQQVAVDVVLAAVERSRSGDHKTVVVVQGGPGSGKSVIASSLMGELAARGRSVVPATGSKAFTTTLRKLSGQRNQRATSLFRGTGAGVPAGRTPGRPARRDGHRRRYSRGRYPPRPGPARRPWNLRGDRALPGAPPSSLWASQPDGFHQVGCVYTAQGFEYDWNGVIIGPDFVWRDNRWVSRREFNTDPDFRSRKTVTDDDFDALVRNVYKVLLTRGMIGTLIYSTDAETREFLTEMVGASNFSDRQVSPL